jgi:hypothetical protein
MDPKKPTREELRQAIGQAIASLAAKGLIYDSGRRRNGQIVWVTTPGRSLQAPEKSVRHRQDMGGGEPS